jgi:RNA-directed DNA polymerase
VEVGERQKKLSRWAEADRSKRFDDLFDLLHQEDGRRTAQKHVQQNAGCRTAGGEGVTMRGFEEDLEGNLRRRRETLKGGGFEPHPVRRTYSQEVKAGGRMRERP